MCAEASTVLRAVAANFFFNCWCLEIPSDNRIRHIPRCVHDHAQGFRLEATRGFVTISYRGALLSTLLHATVYMFLNNLLNVLVQIAKKMKITVI
jgi:dUTPase